MDAQDKKGREDKNADALKVTWDTSKMKTSYANVCNVSSTREEVTLLLGTNQAVHPGQRELSIELSDRIILNPYAAKRLLYVLKSVIDQYESRFGALKIESGTGSD